MNRLLLIARNKHFPTLSGARRSPAPPDASRPVVLPGTGRDAPTPRAVSLPPSAARNWARSAGRAPLYDATAEQWITPPSGMTPDAGASADPGHQMAHKRLEFSAPPGGALGPTETPPGDFLKAVQDVVTVISGMIVLGGLAFFLMVLA